ncbi:MAG: hypothetical protein SFT92_04740 [Rickettsiales bacterium]|nr:hypothetical protein [Rickettsiales bacterium]
MLYLGLWLPIFAAVIYTARRCGWDRATLLGLLAALSFYYFHFYSSDFLAFAPDVLSHTGYIEFIAKQDRIPAPNERDSGASYHSPVFYVAAAALYKLASLTDARDPLDATRHIAVMLYMIFIMTAVALLRCVFNPATPAYRMALMLLLFWPVGVAISGRLHCDLLLYVGQMGCIYYLSRWVLEQKTPLLGNAFLCVAIACLGKSSAVVFFILTLLVWAASVLLLHKRKKILFSPRVLASAIIAFLCLSWVQQRNSVLNWSQTVEPNTSANTLAHMFLSFNPLLFMEETIINQHQGESQIRFWHWFLRSMILGDFIGWHALSIVFAFGAVWLSMLAYVLVSTLLAKQMTASEKRLAPLLIFIAGSMVASLIWMRYVQPGNPGLADARYIHPIIVLFAIFYGKTLEWHQRCGRIRWLQVGTGLAYGFVFLTFCLFIAQHLIFSKVYEGGLLGQLNLF